MSGGRPDDDDDDEEDDDTRTRLDEHEHEHQKTKHVARKQDVKNPHGMATFIKTTTHDL